MNTLAIIGAGGFGKQVLPIAQELRAKAGQDVVFADLKPLSDQFGDLPLLAMDQLSDSTSYVVAVANAEARMRIVSELNRAGLSPGRLISLDAKIAEDVELGGGAIVCDFSIIEPYAKIGSHFQANSFSFVAHQCTVGDYVTLGPRATCNGNVRIEDGAYIGAGALIKQGTPDKPLTIGKGATIGMGAVVTKDVPAGVIVVGNPAKPLKRR